MHPENENDGPRLRHAVVDPDWVDIYGHMNMAVYVRLFDELGHDILADCGFGEPYTRRFSQGLFTVSANLRYLKEVRTGAPLTIGLTIRRADDKRLWTDLEMRHADEGYVAATMEQLAVNVSLLTRRAVPFPPELDPVLAEFRRA